MEGIGDGLPQSSQGPHHCQDDARDWRNRVSRYPAAGGGGHGAGEGGSLFRNRGKAGMSYALQCDHHGGHLEHGSHKGCKALKKPDGDGQFPALCLYLPQLSAVSR